MWRCEALAVAVAGVEGREGAAGVGLGVEGSGDAEDLEVGLEGVGERLEALAYLDLARFGEAGVAVAIELVDGPGVGRGAEDEVAPEEVVRRPHSKTTSRPAGTSSVLPRCRAGSGVWVSRQRRAAARCWAVGVPRGTPWMRTSTG